MNQRIGHARVSTMCPDLQLDALRRAKVDSGFIYEDKASGSSDRPALASCLKALRSGDTWWSGDLIDWGAACLDLVRIVGELEARGIGFESLTEKIDTTSAAGKLIFHVFAALAEFERNLTLERTQAGLLAARARGRSGGRKPKLDAKQIRQHQGTCCATPIPASPSWRETTVSRERRSTSIAALPRRPR